MSAVQLQVGDRVFHPLYGPGTMSARGHVERDGQPTDTYTIQLDSRAILEIPVNRVESVGLRRPVNGVQTILDCLRTAARPLPDAPLMRVEALRVRWRSPGAEILAETVRDLIARRLTPSDRRWLDQAVARLSAEAAMTDHIAASQAATDIQDGIERSKWRPDA